MKRRVKKAFEKTIIIMMLMFLFTGCSAESIADFEFDATVPYSSDEYENGDWTVDELVSHFEELGFLHIEVEEYTTFDESETQIFVTVVDDISAWTPTYRDLKKGETIGTANNIRISKPNYVQLWTTENSPELIEIAQISDDSERITALKEFMNTRHGDYIEFDGVVTDWYDELWYASGITFSVGIKDYGNSMFTWESVLTKDLGFGTEYSYGSVKEGAPVHIYGQIKGFNIEIISISIYN